MARRLVPSRRGVMAFVAGLLVAAALPPWGIWPLAFFGIALFETSLGEHASGRERLARGWVFGAAWLLPGMAWMWFLTIPGYIVAVAFFAALHALAALVAPRGRWRVVGRPAAHTLAEAIRFCFPFGGVPLASLPIGQAAGPFAGTVRIGGAILLTWFVFQIGFALAGPSPFVPALARQRGANPKGDWLGVTAFLVALAVWLLSPLADARAGDGKQAGLRVAAVQGGGPQGTHAIHTNARDVFDRHIAATRTIAAGAVDMVVWPENVIDVASFADSEELTEVIAEAKRIGAPFVVGVTEDADGGSRFLNAQVVVTPDGQIASRYEKVRRVPFGEYMPLRGLLHALGAPTDLVPRDAVAGKGPAVLSAPAPWGTVRFGVVISWEVFFGGRVNEGVVHGGEFIINPTNGSSYTWTILQSQQVASSRLRALEQHRWLVQVAPTGFSAFVSPEGDVFQRTGVSETKVITREITMYGGRSLYSRTGNLPWVLLMTVVLAGAWWVPGRVWWRERRAAPPVTTET
jgi:apolipoprotein N-acyltransferase